MLAVVKCVICNHEAFVRDSSLHGKYTCLSLSCGCENVLCPQCDKPSWNVLYSEGEYPLICDNCCIEETEDSEIYEPPSRFVSKKWKEQNRAYSLDDIRKKYPRAYLKWTEDEKVTFHALRNKGKTSAELDAIFQRQPGVSRLPGILDRFIPDSAAISLLGERVECSSCNHEAILTYSHLEKVAEKEEAAKNLTVGVLELSKEILLNRMKISFKCGQCEARARDIK